jgi:hypothetical protein
MLSIDIQQTLLLRRSFLTLFVRITSCVLHPSSTLLLRHSPAILPTPEPGGAGAFSPYMEASTSAPELWRMAITHKMRRGLGASTRNRDAADLFRAAS